MKIFLEEKQWQKLIKKWKINNPNGVYPEMDLNCQFYVPRVAHLKPNITYRCDRMCWNCNRAASICPADKDEDMEPRQLQELLEESVKIDKKWTHITLTGGEPTMHEKFEEFVDILVEYKKKYAPNCIIDTYTYHHPKFYYRIEKILKKYPDFVIKDTNKNKIISHKIAMYKAPIDDVRFGTKHVYIGCNDGARLCGLGFDNSGIYCCSVACGVARVFGLKGIQKLVDATVENLIAQYQEICSKCGFYGRYRTHGRQKNLISPTWEKAIKQWHANRKLKLQKNII